MSYIKTAQELNRTLKAMSLRDRIIFISQRFNQVVFQTELTEADQLLTWRLTTLNVPVRIFAGENLGVTEDAATLLSVTRDRYDIAIGTVSDWQKALKSSDAVIKTANNSGKDAKFVTWDDAQNHFVLNPLADFSEEQIINRIFAHEIPINFPLNRLASTSRKQKDQAWVVQSSLGLDEELSI